MTHQVVIHKLTMLNHHEIITIYQEYAWNLFWKSEPPGHLSQHFESRRVQYF